MSLEEIAILLSCHSLEDFPVHHEGAEAENLLACWTALWHPVLLARVGGLPTFHQTDDPPEPGSGRVFAIPQVSEPELPVGWSQRCAKQGAVVLTAGGSRDEMVESALRQLDPPAETVAAELVAEFYALGFGFLQVELLTRQMRYMGTIDEVYFAGEVQAAAEAAVRGEGEAADGHLANCYDILGQARDQFYPVDSYLLDLTLVAETTIGAQLRRHLESPRPTNLLISASVVEQISQREPETLAALRAALEAGHVCLVGGEYEEGDLALWSHEQILAELRRGLAIYCEHLGQVPQIFGRRRFGLNPILPQILAKLGFRGALHVTFDGGRFPQADQSKCQWEGCDGTTIDAYAHSPLDVSDPQNFLGLCHRLGNSMDTEHVASVCFAHWPGQATSHYADLQRVAARGPALGKFVTLVEFFDTTDATDLPARFEADEYLSPYLRAAVSGQAADALSQYSRLQTTGVRAAAAQALETMQRLVEQSPADLPSATELPRAAEHFAKATAGPSTAVGSGHLLVNPLLAGCRHLVELPDLIEVPDAADHVRAADQENGNKQVVVDVPAMGFAWVGPGSGDSPKRKGKEIPLVEENVLRNEHMLVIVDQQTGAIRAIQQHQRRGNLLSQQLAFRQPPDHSPQPGPAGAPDPYSIMAADSLEVTANSRVKAELTARGRLVDRSGTTLAGFEQRITLWRGSRIVELDVTLDPRVEPSGSPWQSYYAVRFAWSEPDAALWRSVAETAQPNVLPRFEAPQYVEIRQPAAWVCLLTGGLPFHERSGDRMLDTLLIVPGETRRKFRLGIGIDLAQPAQSARQWLLPASELSAPTGRPSSASGWLFHIDARHLVATAWEPVSEANRNVGFRLRLLETSGKGGRGRISAFRNVGRARSRDFQGNSLGDLPVEQGNIVVDYGPYEWLELEGYWED